MHSATRCPLPISAENVLDGDRPRRRASGRRPTTRAGRGSRSCPPTVSPGVSRSSRKAVNFVPSTLANRMNRSAHPALVIHCFGAVDDVVRAALVQDGGGADVHGVRPRAGLRQGQRGHDPAVHAALEVARPAATSVPKLMSGNVPMPWWAKTVEARPPKAERFSLIPAMASTFRPQPAVRLRHLGHEDAELGGLAEERQDDLLVAPLDPLEMRCDLLRRELLDGPHQEAFPRPPCRRERRPRPATTRRRGTRCREAWRWRSWSAPVPAGCAPGSGAPPGTGAIVP